MSEQKIISEGTPVRIGLVILFLGVFGSGVWWASGISSKLDSIIANQQTFGSNITEIKGSETTTEKEVSDLTLRVAILESKIGDPTKK